MNQRLSLCWITAAAICAVVFAALLISEPASTRSSEPAAIILVGQNVLVSHEDVDVPHNELLLAADPRDARVLLGGSTTFTGPDGWMECKAYVSADGGNTWSGSSFPNLHGQSAGDPQVIIMQNGTMVFVALRARVAGTSVYRSTDDGRSWSKPTSLPFIDHEQVEVDRTKSRFAGRLYMAGAPKQGVLVYHSDDGGKTFARPAWATRGTAGVTDIAVLHDGTLIVPLTFYDRFTGPSARVETSVAIVRSTDGGETFGAPRKIVAADYGRMRDIQPRILEGKVFYGTIPSLAVDNRTARFNDRLYAAWPEMQGLHLRIVMSFSSDGGLHWSVPKSVAPATDGDQTQQALAVNRDGVVGLTWFDTRNNVAALTTYDEYFAASLDGGQSFLRARRVSTQASDPFSTASRREYTIPYPEPRPARDKISIHFFNSRAGGGDYMGLTADSAGIFHAFWIDTRSGSSQIYTARLAVATGPKPVPTRHPSNITRFITVIVDPTRFDPATNDLFIPIRLRNVSQTDLYGPFSIEVTSLGFPSYPQFPTPANFRPLIVNSANGKQGAGALFNLDPPAGDFAVLAPGDVSEAAVLRIHERSPGLATTGFTMSDFTISVRGFVGNSKLR